MRAKITKTIKKATPRPVMFWIAYSVNRKAVYQRNFKWTKEQFEAERKRTLGDILDIEHRPEKRGIVEYTLDYPLTDIEGYTLYGQLQMKPDLADVTLGATIDRGYMLAESAPNRRYEKHIIKN